ncbi:alpha/beta fold hydrolase [Knoellia sinensis]|uniref:alpha/beta fold hydrolase n=1 Tax=Knoellia sinensis TaxID=136100 RepID=UPI0012EC9875|nr:alpha/beta hydrolase [Knoellia sinensis]
MSSRARTLPRAAAPEYVRCCGAAGRTQVGSWWPTRERGRGHPSCSCTVLPSTLGAGARNWTACATSSPVPMDFSLGDFADALAAVIVDLGLGPTSVAGLSWGGTVALELYRRHPDVVAGLVLIDTYAGWKGSLPASEVRARVDGVQHMLASAPEAFDPTLPGLFASEPGEDVELVVIPRAGHVSTLERPDLVNDAIREFCRSLPPTGCGPRRPAGARTSFEAPVASAVRANSASQARQSVRPRQDSNLRPSH